MAATRLTHYLEEEAFFFYPTQTGFTANLAIQDSIYILRRLLRRTRYHRPHILVAVDLRKAFDTVSHQAALEAFEKLIRAKESGISWEPSWQTDHSKYAQVV